MKQPRIDKSELAIGIPARKRQKAAPVFCAACGSFIRNGAVDDPEWLRYQSTQACVITGEYGGDHESVVGAHVGTHGKSMKTDDEVLPVLQRLHVQGHQSGEISMFRRYLSDVDLRNALRAWARELYVRWKHGA